MDRKELEQIYQQVDGEPDYPSMDDTYDRLEAAEYLSNLVAKYGEERVHKWVRNAPKMYNGRA